MVSRSLIRYSLPVFLGLVLTLPQASGQFGNTYYHMFGVPQANQLNPAFQPSCDGYLGLPALAPVRFQVESNSLTYGDIFAWNSSEKKYMTFMHPSGDKDKFMNALEPVNLIRAELASSLISLGWRQEGFYFTLDFSERAIQAMSFSKDFAEFLIYGNKNTSTFNFGDLSENLSYFHQLSLGVSYNLEDEMQFGIRAKLLLGGANATTRKSELSLKTSIEEWDFRSDVKVDASIPFLESVPLDSEGYLDMDSIGKILEDTISIFDVLFGLPTGPDLLKPPGLNTIGGLKNPGIAIDFGFSYTPIEKLTVSASVVDLGFIRWKNYVYNFEQDLDYTFEGIEFRLEEDYSAGEALLDSLKQDMKIKVSQNPYTTMMTGKVYLGAAYNLTEKVRFGGVFRTRIQNYRFYNQFTVSANVQPISMFSASLSYSIYGNSYMNLGLGLSLRAGPLNLYFITDQAPSAYFFPKEFSSLNFRMGLNIVWGCAAIPKAMKDRPLID